MNEFYMTIFTYLRRDRLDCISVSVVYCAIQVATGAGGRTAASSCVYFVRERPNLIDAETEL